MRFGGIEGLKNAVELFAGDTDASITDGEFDPYAPGVF